MPRGGSKLHELAVVTRALVRAQRRRRHAEPALGRDLIDSLQARLPADAVSEARVVDLPANGSPWTATGIDVSQGDVVTTFAVGRVYLSRVLGIWGEAANQLWFRTGAGPIFRGTRATHTFTAEADGTLELASHPPGDWTDPGGGHTTGRREPKASGGLTVLVVRWSQGADTREVLRDAAQAEPGGLAAIELARRAADLSEPDGWHHLWSVGRSEIYLGDSEIKCSTHADVGILKREVDLPLTDATRLRWSWRVDELPSQIAEDILPTHDYLSIALEFDNGQDLTWQWSAELPPEYSYRCPLPHWDGRETHLVVRSGREDLGRWVSEERAVRRDYAAAVGSPPERIVGVWLIAVSLFQRGHGRCEYGTIEIADGERSERVLG